MKKLSKNEKIEVRDRGDSSIISLVIALPLVLALFFTLIDSGLYFMNSQIINSEANNGARIIAIYGGNGDADRMTQIEAAYGGSGATKGECGESAKTATECGIFKILTESNMLTGVKINSVKCGPRTSLYVGHETSCTVDWEYSGIPGSAMSFIVLDEKDANGNVVKNSEGKTVKRSPFSHTQTKGTAKSEVKLDESHMKRR